MHPLTFFLLSAFALVALGDHLNADGKKTCLREHNNYRRQLAAGYVKNGAGQAMPKAANMNELKYSKDLEAKAQQWASSCPGMRHTPSIHYGQNLYWTSQEVDQATALRQATQAWWNEVKLYRNTNLKLTSAVFNLGVGHFTQMAQAKNTKVGCSVQSCSGTYVVCNYDGQNFLNQPIYRKGGKCSKCEGGRKCSNSLCK
ncbi:Venom allergen-like protein [Aphelenchoides fujianensis]|nr:Venom allergen-like protein [Aphelenchoides fujianensis]